MLNPRPPGTGSCLLGGLYPGAPHDPYLMGVDDGDEPGEQAAEEGHEHRLHHVVFGQRPVLHRGGGWYAGHGVVVLWGQRPRSREGAMEPAPPPDARVRTAPVTITPPTPNPHPVRLQVTKGSGQDPPSALSFHTPACHSAARSPLYIAQSRVQPPLCLRPHWAPVLGSGAPSSPPKAFCCKNFIKSSPTQRPWAPHTGSHLPIVSSPRS